jgi:hypothetical protein
VSIGFWLKFIPTYREMTINSIFYKNLTHPTIGEYYNLPAKFKTGRYRLNIKWSSASGMGIG